MTNKRAVSFAILAAFLYAFSTPFAKVILRELSPTMVAGLFYLGAGVGMFLVLQLPKQRVTKHLAMTKKQLPAVIGMIILDILAPILLFIGLQTTPPENVSLLNNFEIVATSLIAFFLFKEKIAKPHRMAIVLVFIASVILTFERIEALQFSIGSLYVLLAASCWGLENNLTRQLSIFDPRKVVILKGIFSGLGSLIITLLIQAWVWNAGMIVFSLFVGFIAYGLSIFFYVSAQKEIGAARTSTFYAIAPFIGVILSFLIFREVPYYTFYIALLLMAIGSYFATRQVAT